MKRTFANRISMSLIAITVWFALVLQFVIMMNNPLPAGFTRLTTFINFFSYFTILSNILVAFGFSCVLLAQGTRAGRFFTAPAVRSATSLYILVVGLVYSLALRHVWEPKGWQLVADTLLHDVVPIAAVLHWVCFIPGKVLTWKMVFPWLIFPGVYFAYSIVRGSVMGWYPYPFINVNELGTGRVMWNAILILAAFMLLGLLLILVNRKLPKTR